MYPVFKTKVSESSSAVDTLGFYEHKALSFPEATAKLKDWPAFGTWSAFKAIDMCERILGLEIAAYGLMRIPDEPLKALSIVTDELGFGEDYGRTLKELKNHFGKFDAPPNYNRKINIQEIETILCKYKSYINDKYYVGKDTEEIKNDLFMQGDLATTLMDKLP